MGRVSMLVGGLVRLLVLAALLVGVPVALVRVGAAPWQLEIAREAVTGAADGATVRATVVALLAALVWLVWARLAGAVMAEAVRSATGRCRASTSITGRLAAGLVAGAVLVVVALRPAPGRAAESRVFAVTNASPAAGSPAPRSSVTSAPSGTAVSIPVVLSSAAGGAALVALADGVRRAVLRRTPVRSVPVAEPGDRVSTAPRGLVQAAPTGRPDTTHGRPPGSFLVRLLGPVEVVGPDGRAVVFERARSLELVAWLALHRNRASRDAARAALWDGDVSDRSVANVVSEARRALNRHRVPPDGGDWLARGTGDRLVLHPEVVTDVELLSQALVEARRSADPAAVTNLERALGEVRGTPFAGAAYPWADAEGFTASLTLLVVAAAAELGEHRLSAGDVAGALASTETGLAVLPAHDDLVALRLRAHAARGDLAAIRLEWAAYERVMTADPFGEVSPRLVSLRRELLGAGCATR